MNDIIIRKSKINYRLYNLQYSHKDCFLVFLHDGLGSVDQLNDFPSKISDELKLPALSYDRQGHGGSDKLLLKRNKNYFSLEAKKLKILLSNLKICNNLVLIGSSDGGTISLIYASLFSEKIQGIVTIAAHTFVEEKTIAGVIDLKEKYFKSGFREHLVKYHGDKTDFLFADWMNLWLSASFRNWNIFKELKKIKCKVLALQGDIDEYGTNEQLKSIKKYIGKKCIVKLIKDANHFPHLKKKNEVIGLIKKFIVDEISCPDKSSSPV